MLDGSQKPKVPPWLYKLFTGHQYPYVRRLAKFDKKDRKIGDPSSEPNKDCLLYTSPSPRDATLSRMAAYA
mgnify:CR=1 FL=1